MGQAKKRGSFEQRVQQSRDASAERIESRYQEEKRQREEFEAYWAALSEEEREVLRTKKRERARVRQSIFGLMGAATMMAAHTPGSRLHQPK